MNQSSVLRQLQPYMATLRGKRKLWASITAGCFLAAVAFALLKSDVWEASQSLVLRDEAAGQLSGQGRFDSIDMMKAAQEMVVEVGRNQAVLEATLREVGPPPGKKVSATWPTLGDVDDFRKEVAVSPPNGAEFGTTEVLHLSVEAPSPERAIHLTQVLCDQMEKTLKNIRNHRAESVIAELENAEYLARKELERATAALKSQETQIGSDLGELRSLNDTSSGEGNLRNVWNQIHQQIRDSEAEVARLQEQLRILATAQDNPEQLIATPNQLLESQPALRRLKDGLVDAQLRTSELMGRMSESHPQVKSAIAAEDEVRQNLRRELAVAIGGVEADLQVQRTRMESISSQEREVRKRLDNLASVRAPYANLVADVEKCNLVLREAHEKLADARANKRASEMASLITRIDEPTTGQYPLGPGKTVIAAAGLLGGMMISLGLIVLLTPTGEVQGRRWTDRLWGRRATDGSGNMDPGDRRTKPAAPGTSPGRRAADTAGVPPLPLPPSLGQTMGSFPVADRRHS